MAELKDNKIENLDAGQLALRCAEFFMELGESCLQFYHKYNKEKERKTKIIKKSNKQRPRMPKKIEGELDDVNEELKKKLPKKPLTAYIIYFQQKKPNFVQKYPGLNLSDLTKLIAKQWKQIDNNQKKPYLAQAQDDRKRYETQMKQFKLQYGLNNEEIEDENEAIAEHEHHGEQMQERVDRNDQELDDQKLEDIENQNDNFNSNSGAQAENKEVNEENEAVNGQHAGEGSEDGANIEQSDKEDIEND